MPLSKSGWRPNNGAEGGILAASHVMTGRFVEVGRRFAGNDVVGARAAWAPLAPLVPLLFAEANPIPIKHLLWRQGLIASPECRLPLTRISDGLAQRLAFEGIVSVCPYYNRPSQDGLLVHFRTVAAATDRDVLIYNIPYRTAVNLANDSLLELAEVTNIVGVKDSSGSIVQSLDLLARKPADFSVLTGEDALYFTMMANGA